MTDPHDFQGIVTKLRTTKGSPYALDVMKEAADVIDAVLALHEPIPAADYGVRDRPSHVQVCTGCGQDDGNWQYWPCPTVRALGGK